MACWWLKLFLGWSFLAGVVAGAEVDALFFVVGDQHSAYGRTAQLVAHIDRVKQQNPGVPVAILIDGDSFEYGNVVARRSEGAVDLAMFAALARRGPTILNLGNHEPEFHDVPESVERISATGVIVVGNLVNRANGQLFAPAATTLNLGRIEVVVTGIATDALAQYRAAVRPSLDLAVPEVWAKHKFPELLSRAPVKIVLSHAGLRQDRGIFPFVPDGTLIAGAHDHAQFVERMGRTVYFHSGSWNSHVSIVRLKADSGGPAWDVEQQEINEDDPADPEMAAVIRGVEARHLSAEDLQLLGRTSKALSRTEAAQFAVRAMAGVTKADAAFIGNTTFGDGLPAGGVSRFALDACVRFDGTIWVAEITGARLRELMRGANQGPSTPFRERRGEFQFADGPTDIVSEKLYRIATNDWGVRNQDRYFGGDKITFTEVTGLKLKAIVIAALAGGDLK